MATETLSIRHRALLKLRDNLRAIVKDQPLNDPSPLAFSRVELGPLGTPDKLKRFTCGIVTGPETKRHLFPFMEATVRVTVEFYITVQASESPQGLVEEVLLLLQRVIAQDERLGGLIIDLNEVRNETDLETYGDKTVAGAIFYDMKYRHNMGDPRALS